MMAKKFNVKIGFNYIFSWLLQQGPLNNIFIWVKGSLKKLILKYYFWPMEVFLSQGTADKGRRQESLPSEKT